MLRTLLGLGLIMGLTPAAPGPHAVRTLDEALKDPAVAAALRTIEDRRAETTQPLCEMGGIVSPSGHEQRRAERVAAKMREMGLSQVRVESGGAWATRSLLEGWAS